MDGAGRSPFAHDSDDEDDGDVLERRADMVQTKKSLRFVRGLCKEYGLSFRLPEGSSFRTTKEARRLMGGLGDSRHGDFAMGKDAGSSEGSVSSFEFDSADEMETEGSRRDMWPTVRELLGNLQGGVRLATLLEVNAVLSKSGFNAEAYLEELAALDHEREVSASEHAATGDTLDSTQGAPGSSSLEASAFDEHIEANMGPLAGFRSQDIAAAQAIQRCLDLVPELQKRAIAKAEARRREAQLLAEEEERRQLENERALEELENETGLHGETERKLRTLGDLPSDADPDLAKILEVQRAEARRLVKLIQDVEHEVVVNRLALEHCDSKLVYEGKDFAHEDLAEAVALTRELKAVILTEKWADADRKLEEERQFLDVPTEEEVQEAVEEQQKLQKEVDRMSDQVKRMLDALRQAHPDGQNQEDVSRELASAALHSQGQIRKKWAIQAWDRALPSLPVGLDKVYETQPLLQKECAEVEQFIHDEDLKLSSSEAVFKNAENTLKVIETSKIIYLEQVARERPELVRAALKAENSDTESSVQSFKGEDSDEDEAVGEEEDAAQRLALGAEERWLRTHLSQFRVEDGGIEADGVAEFAPSSSVKVVPEHHAFDEVAQDILRLARALDAAHPSPEAGVVASPEAEAEDELDSGDELKELQKLSPEEAADQLRHRPHEEVAAIIRLQGENAELARRISQTQEDIDRLRGRRGATQELLGGIGVPMARSALDLCSVIQQRLPEAQIDTSKAQASQDADPKLVQDVVAKARMVNVLQMRWWKERQDPSTTVRRALAAENLPQSLDLPDLPPTRLQATLFERVQESMTMP